MALSILSFFFASIITSPLSFAAIIDSKQQNDTVYFLFSNPNKIIRYNLTSASFLAEIPLDNPPTAFNPTEQYIYIGYNRELRRINKAGSSNTLVRNFTTDILHLSNVNSFIQVIEESDTISSINSADFSIRYTNHIYSVQSILGSSSNQSYYYRRNDFSTIYKTTLAENGGITIVTSANSRNSKPSGNELFRNTFNNKIYDNSGIIYTSELGYEGSLAGPFNTMTFLDDRPIVLRNKTLFIFNKDNIDQGQITLDHTPTIISAYNNIITSFVISEADVLANKTSIDSLRIPIPDEAPNPINFNYKPEFIETDGKNNIYLVDTDTLSIFNWQVNEQRYGPSLSLLKAPSWVTLSSLHQRLYLGYPSGRITYFDVSLGKDAKEIHFNSLAKSVEGLFAIDSYLISADAGGVFSGITNYSYNLRGEQIDNGAPTHERNNLFEYIWNPQKNYLYVVSSSRITLFEYLQGSFIYNSNNITNLIHDDISNLSPLRINNDGNLLINGKGQILNSDNFSLMNSLTNDIDDAIWIGSLLATIKSGTTTLQLWKDNYEILSETNIEDASNIRLLSFSKKLFIIKQSSSGPIFTIYDISNLPDMDEDGINDLIDNCTTTSNPTQKDFDQDNKGDDCDLDDDNDQIPDIFEIKYGLSAFNPMDAEEDLDGDGFNNRAEFFLETAIDDPNSKPDTINDYTNNFSNGIPQEFYSFSDTLSWKIKESNNNQVLHSSPVTMRSGHSSIFFTADFSAGTFSFKNQFLGSNPFTYDFEVFIDNNSHQISIDNSEWKENYFPLPEGIHTIEFRFSIDVDKTASSAADFMLIDEIKFGPDKDSDNIYDNIDNCPEDSNRDQYDSDQDGLGNVCDIDPYGDDRDGDGHTNVNDNCPEIFNPDQYNIDDDELGDACDSVDDVALARDKDQDGIDNEEDNCPLIKNTSQNDFDWDRIGDLCDMDDDNDGILDVDEDKYDFLNPLNSEDALQDFDNDGASNLYELHQGLNPEIADEYNAFDLTEYFPLGTIQYFYVTDDQLLHVSLTKSGKNNQFEMVFNDEIVWVIERTPDGIYIISASDNNGPNKRSFKNIPIMPSKLIPGKITTFLGETNIEGSNNFDTISTQWYLKNIGEFSWHGNTYESVTIIENGNETVYLKGIGPVSRYGLTLNSFNIETFASPENTNNGDSKNGGGPFSIIFLFTLLVLTLANGYKRKL